MVRPASMQMRMPLAKIAAIRLSVRRILWDMVLTSFVIKKTFVGLKAAY